MIGYLGTSLWHQFIQALSQVGNANVLVSYFQMGGKEKDWLRMKEENGFKNMMLDSGAYSAWRMHKPVDLDNYIEFLLRNGKYFSAYVALDDCRRNKEVSGKVSKRNYIRMRKAGLNPLPVWHLGENPEILRFYNDNTDYIGVGGIAGQSRVGKLCSLVKNNVKKGTKVHLFGVANREDLLAYPYYSLDSTSWYRNSIYKNFVVFSNGKLKARTLRKRENVEKYFREISRMGVDFLELYKGNSLLFHNAKEYVKYFNFITEVWRRRGVIWDED